MLSYIIAEHGLEVSKMPRPLKFSTVLTHASLQRCIELGVVGHTESAILTRLSLTESIRRYLLPPTPTSVSHEGERVI